ncbi:hypothetical protein HPP92_013727 [Vanilla planifolia]|uniref:C3H1-type domain-containing protein n=1 Tax=Vanilla planifolia TaxID=51239 RepID=A0A835QW41_VANPL|nr:hypothetical protein HPP92_026449 [Vanilla planifolia]KAG0479008.1 hypothetical protein HPP92_013727 [Vanilla planifolia]
MPDNSGYSDLSVSAGDVDSLGEVRLGVHGADIDEDVEEFEEEDEEVLEDNGEYDVEEEVEDVEDEEEKEEEDCKDEQTDDVLAELGSGQEEDAEAAEEEEEEHCDDLGVEDVKDKAAGMVVEDMLDGAEGREVEAQSDSKGPVKTGDGDAELAAAVLEDVDDLSVTLKSGENDEDQNPVSSTDWVGNAEMHQHGRSKMLSTCTNGFNVASVGKTNCTVNATQAPSKENGILRALEGETFKGALHENEISNKAPKHVKDNDIKADGSHCSGSDNSRYAQLQENVLTVEDTIKNKSKIVKHDTTEKGESDLRGLSNLLMLENIKAARVLTPQKRQRSSSPITEMVKKPAITCVYYARGWCIKGSSCKFLHQDGINKTALDDGINKTVQQAMEDKAGNNGKCDSLDIPGTKEIVEGSKASPLMLNPSNAEGPLECNSPLQRALVRAYGPGISSQFHEEYSRLGTGSSSETSTLVQNSNSLYAYGNTGDFAGKSMHGKLPNQDSYISHNFSVVSSGLHAKVCEFMTMIVLIGKSIMQNTVMVAYFHCTWRKANACKEVGFFITCEQLMNWSNLVEGFSVRFFPDLTLKKYDKFYRKPVTIFHTRSGHKLLHVYGYRKSKGFKGAKWSNSGGECLNVIVESIKDDLILNFNSSIE